MIAPVHKPHITSPYGKRISPITGQEELHPGIDYVDLNGNRTVLAIADGVIAHDKDNYNDALRWTPPESYGNFVVEKINFNGLDVFIYYCHLEYNVVSIGQAVKQGDALGNYADVGMSKGSHLHIQAMILGSNGMPEVYPITKILEA